MLPTQTGGLNPSFALASNAVANLAVQTRFRGLEVQHSPNEVTVTGAVNSYHDKQTVLAELARLGAPAAALNEGKILVNAVVVLTAEQIASRERLALEDRGPNERCTVAPKLQAAAVDAERQDHRGADVDEKQAA